MKIDRLLEKYKEVFYIPKIPEHKPVEYKEIIRECRESLSDMLVNHPTYRRITICVTDNTRPFPDRKILPVILKSLLKHKIKKNNITILIATGLHRHLTAYEMIRKFGMDIVSNFRIVQHNPRSAVRIRTPRRDLYINRLVRDSDLLIGTGVFEPHQYARFSGGNKIFVIGCGGYKTIEYIHSADMVLKRGVRIGSATHNPFRDIIEYLAGHLPPRWVVNIVRGTKGKIIHFDLGSPEEVFRRLSDWYAEEMHLTLPRRYDGVWTKIERSKGINLYQASRAPTYIALLRSPIIWSGAPIVVSAPLDEGIGKGSAEREFAEIMRTSRRNEVLFNILKSRGYAGGGQRALMVLKVMMRNPIIFTGFKKRIELQRENLFFIQEEEEAFSFVKERFRVREMVYIEDPFNNLFSYKAEQ